MTQLFSFDNSPSNLDTWINDSDHTYIANCHMAHGDGVSHRTKPMASRFTFPPRSETQVPKMFRSAIHQYVCNHAECRESPGSKLCFKDHDSIVIIGGQCPMLKRKDRPAIPMAQALDTSLVEVKEMDMSGRPSYRLRNPVDFAPSHTEVTTAPPIAPLAAARKPSRTRSAASEAAETDADKHD